MTPNKNLRYWKTIKKTRSGLSLFMEVLYLHEKGLIFQTPGYLSQV